MRKAAFASFVTALLIAVFALYPPTQKAQEENPFKNLQITIALQRPPQKIQASPNQTERSAQIKDIQVFGKKSGIAYTSEALFRTDDNGENWREIVLPKNFSEIIGAVYFEKEQQGAVILTDAKYSSLYFLRTEDGGASWTKQSLDLPPDTLAEANPDKIRLLTRESGKNAVAVLRLASSSNFFRVTLFKTNDGGASWESGTSLAERSDMDLESVLEYGLFHRIGGTVNGRSVGLVSEDGGEPSMTAPLLTGENALALDLSNNGRNGWLLTQAGECESFKSNCVQTTRLLRTANGGKSWREITPPEIKELTRIEKQTARLRAENSVFAQQPPNGSTRISLNRGFDKCTAATSAQMQTWWNTSPFYDANIYISGRNRGCSQPQLSAAWVNQVSAMGWGLIPTVVGYQAPCSVCTSCQKHSSDPLVAETQGRGEADIAITDANNLGLTQGTILYYDMERYDDLSGTGACSTPVKAFLKGWTDRLKEQGYVSGVYGSPTNAVGDWLNIPAPSRMDAIWMARWDNVPSVWFYASPSPMIPNDAWANHQRIKQYQAPHNETWGGVTFNIDGNIADGPVAGVQPAKNKTADFDGDGRTDISVFRPEAGAWYILNSSNSSFSGINFGISTDILAPGDFDGDGKTDYGVFRPSEGTWYIQLRTTLRAQQFGASGDIPVPADYNGDGFTDIAVFRPSNGYWYIWNSSGSPNLLRVEQFGATGDKPVPGDYDGDGKTDLAVFRPADGTWYLLRSQAGFTGIQFGISSDKPVQADYDGDGKTDLGVYRDGVWYLLRSQQGFAGIQFGVATDKPAPGDFDGDGRADLAVFRDGVWYLLQSQAGFTGVQFGVGSDRTIPAAYIPQN